MKIISHRGVWRCEDEKNSEIAFDRSFSLGFGTETDIRDHCEVLVISHDMPTGHEMALSDFLKKANDAVGNTLTLALNVKADGLAAAVSAHLKNFPSLDCFVFDMSIPDMRGYFQSEVPVFTRMSEIEREPIWLERASGVWLDAFDSDWYHPGDIQGLLSSGKRVCIVSPELHRRCYKNLWKSLLEISGSSKLLLCTDFPEEAKIFFNFRGLSE